MCGRFTLYDPVPDLVERFGVDEVSLSEEDTAARWNVAPTQPVLAVASSKDGTTRRLGALRWGLVPWWAKDPSIGNRMINARVETLETSRAYQAAFERRRCLIPASGFYEWKRDPDAPERRGRPGRVPYYIRSADGGPLAFGGLWEIWYDAEDRPLRTCTIVTTQASPALAEVHDRMPLVVGPEHWDEWLAPAPLPAEVRPLILRPALDEALVLYPVTDLVNDPRNEGPELVEPVTAAR